MKRRELLKGSVLAGLTLEACSPASDQLIPILVPEEPFVPGEETWIKTTCFECPGACGLTARKIEGRIVKVEGNPEHPLSLGGICARAQATPQSLYHPDRLQTPLVKQQDGSFSETSWEDALDRIAQTLNTQKDLAFLTGSITGHRKEMVQRFLMATGNTHHLIHEPMPTPHFSNIDIRDVEYLVSFGAELLESQPSPVRFSRGLAEMRQGNPGQRGKFVVVGPRLSLTAANADEWIPARPGEELNIALQIIHVLIRDNLHALQDFTDLDTLRAVVAPLQPSANTERLAHEMASHKPTLAIGGKVGSALAQAVSNLNVLLGMNRSENSDPPFKPWRKLAGKEPNSYTLEAALKTLSPPQVLFIANSNPMYSLAPSTGIEDWFASIPFTVSFSSFLDETTSMCQLVLPESMSFERFEDAVPSCSTVSMATLSVPLFSRPLYDTRSMPDALIDIANRIGKVDSFPWSSYEAALREAWSGLDITWEAAKSQGGWWRESESSATSNTVELDMKPIESTQKISEDLVLYIYPSTAFGDGSSAHLPYLQELADPITGVRWGSVVEVGTDYAKKMGIANGDLVQLSSTSGKGIAQAFVTHGIHPKVVAVAAGQGHTQFGRYAKDRGVNAYLLRELNQNGEPLDGTPISIERLKS